MTQGLLNFNSAAISDKGLSEKRPSNEDSYLELAGSGLYAVADGVGGAQAGDVASEMAVEILGEAFINLREDGDAEDRMRSAIDKANASIYQMSRELPQLATMATTLVALHINGNIATIGHVGDSRLYRLDENGILLQETQDHSVVEEEVRAGRMTRDQAVNHPSRNVISRALGAESSVEIDMKTIMFDPNTSFLVCSDGVTRHISDTEIRDLLYMEEYPAEICRMIKERCYERGAEDNLTAIVVKVTAAEEAIEIDQNGGFELEIDEETVATARVGAGAGAGDLLSVPETVVSEPFSVVSNEATDLSVEGKEESSDSGEAFDDYDELEDTEEIIIPTKPVMNTVADTVAEEQAVSGENETPKEVSSYRVDDSPGLGLFGRILSGFVWLLVGVLIGALGYFVYASSFKQNDNPITLPNAAMVNFEQRRRQADADPGKYIAAYSVKPETAADHYLLGRAYLLQRNYGAAKTSLENAVDKLDEANDANKLILEYDILAGLAIAQDEGAQDSLESLIEDEPEVASPGNGAGNEAAPEANTKPKG